MSQLRNSLRHKDSHLSLHRETGVGIILLNQASGIARVGRVGEMVEGTNRWGRGPPRGVRHTVGQGGTLDLDTFTIVGATAPPKAFIPPPGVPPPPEYLPETLLRHSHLGLLQFMVPQGQEIHSVPTCNHTLVRTSQRTKVRSDYLCATQKNLRSNRKMHYYDRTVGYMIARESSKDSSTKLLYCTEAIVALMMQTYLVSSTPPSPQDLITTVVIDEVHNRSAHSDYVLALALAAMQKTSDLRLVLMSATGDHNLVRERIPHCQQLVMKGVMHKVKRRFLEQPLDRSSNLLNQMAQIVITYHNERVGRPLIDETCHSKGVNASNKIMVLLPGLAQIFQFCEILQRALDLGWTEIMIPLPLHGQSPHEDVEAVLSDPSVLASTGKYPLGQNQSLFAPESFEMFSAPNAFQELWAAHREPRLLDHASCVPMLQNQGSLSPV